MTYRDPDGWYLPSRLPQHAAPFGFARPLRHRAHLALRLFVTAGTWAAGLCLIVGSIVLVTNAAAANRSPANHSRTTQSLANSRSSKSNAQAFKPTQARASVSQLPSSPTRTPGQLLVKLTGYSPKTTKLFVVNGSRRWDIRWSYSCKKQTQASQFSVRDVVVSAGEDFFSPPVVDGSGVHGAGVTSLDPGGRRHYLAISSTCAWKVWATQP